MAKRKLKHLSFVSDFKKTNDKERPREKLLKYGAQSLNLWELVAIILRTGEKHKGGAFENVEELSKRLIRECGFKGLFRQKSVTDFMADFDTYKSHSEIIVAISEICRRIHGQYDSFDASDPSKIYKKFSHLKKLKQEQCHVLHIDEKGKCNFSEMVAMGSADEVRVFPSDILRTPIWIGSKNIVIVHNHIGPCEPSQEDISWTLNLVHKTWELHQITISDHIIIGQGAYFSFLEKGIL